MRSFSGLYLTLVCVFALVAIRVSCSEYNVDFKTFGHADRDVNTIHTEPNADGDSSMLGSNTIRRFYFDGSGNNRNKWKLKEQSHIAVVSSHVAPPSSSDIRKGVNVDAGDAAAVTADGHAAVADVAADDDASRRTTINDTGDIRDTNNYRFSRTSDSIGKDLCFRYDVDGCSIPFGLNFFYKALFTPSCDRHDICYHCGVKYHFSRRRCDRAFHSNMLTTCERAYLASDQRMDDLSSELKVKVQRHRTNFRSLVTSSEKLMKWIIRFHMHRYLKQTKHSRRNEGGNYNRIEDFQKFINVYKTKLLVSWIRLLKFGPKTRKQFRLLRQQVRMNHLSRENIFFEFASLNQSPRCSYTLEGIDVTTTSALDKWLGCFDLELLSCKIFAYVYYAAVRTFAGLSYHAKPESFCNQPFVKECLLPI